MPLLLATTSVKCEWVFGSNVSLTIRSWRWDFGLYAILKDRWNREAICQMFSQDKTMINHKILSGTGVSKNIS